MNKWTALLALIFLSACEAALTPGSASQYPDLITPVKASPVTTGEYWRPPLGSSFQLQFSGDLDLSVQADVYDLDLFDTSPATVAEIHTRGNHVVCYISVGAWEDWRPDADQFPADVIGKDYKGWPGEKWLDIRQIDKLAPILRPRLDLCAEKGFDGVEPDNVEIIGNDSGFPITYADQLTFAIWLANEAHVRGLAIGLKNAPDMAADVLPYFDFSVLEDCFVYGWCADLRAFIDAGKLVFAIEYTDMGVDFKAACAEAQSLGLSMLLKHRNLNAYRETCP
jgi:hypothetical protein